MALDIVDVCNRALTLLGLTNLITDINDASHPYAVLCKANIDMVRRAELRKKEWNLAKRTITPAEFLGVPDSEKPDLLGKAFIMPGDFIRAISINMCPTNLSASSWVAVPLSAFWKILSASFRVNWCV